MTLSSLNTAQNESDDQVKLNLIMTLSSLNTAQNESDDQIKLNLIMTLFHYLLGWVPIP